MTIKLNIYIWRTKFHSHKKCLFGLLFSRNAKKADRPNHTDQIILKMFLLCLKETSHKSLKAAAAKRSFPSVYKIDTTCFYECFLFHVITGRHYFFYKFIVTQWFGVTAVLLRSLKQVFWKKSAFYIRYLHNNIAMLLIPEVQNKASTS